MAKTYLPGQFEKEIETMRKDLVKRYKIGLLKALALYILIAITLSVFSFLSDGNLAKSHGDLNSFLKALFSSLSNAAAIFTGTVVIAYYKEGARVRSVYEDFAEKKPLFEHVVLTIDSCSLKGRLTPSATEVVREAALTCAHRALGEGRKYGKDFLFRIQEWKEVLSQ